VFRLYDSRLREVVDIQSARRGELRMHECGPAVHGCAHLGSMRTAMLTDLIRRHAERRGASVVICQTVSEIGHDDTETAYRADSAALNIQPPDYSPRTSESVELTIVMIAELLAAGHAYVAGGGSVYFDARTAPDYGPPAGLGRDELQARHRPESQVDEQKRFQADWVLWTSVPPERDLTWTAPWGAGLPGWHARCSAVSLKFLGDLIDIHVGALDLRFPDHEYERAQSSALVGHEVVQHWVHGEDALFEGREMAASTGNVVLVSDLTRHGLDPLAARLAFLDHHYRQPMNLTWEGLAASDMTVRHWRELVADWADEPSKPMSAEYWPRITAALDDDLDTPAALRVLRDLAQDDQVVAGAKFETFASADRVLGLDLVSLVGRPRKTQQMATGASDCATDHR
jgi:cysteinyl-tRNA synthetase